MTTPNDGGPALLSDAMLVKRMKTTLQAIAKKNQDEWRVLVTFDESGYLIEVIEIADHHTLTTGTGNTVSRAIDNLFSNLPSALKTWGYKL